MDTAVVQRPCYGVQGYPVRGYKIVIYCTKKEKDEKAQYTQVEVYWATQSNRFWLNVALCEAESNVADWPVDQLYGLRG
jgi:hypothetical protein